MAIGRVMTRINSSLFYDFDEIFENLGYDVYFSNWEMQLFLQIPNLTKADVLEWFENIILDRYVPLTECDSHFIPIYYVNANDEIENNISQASYVSEYISTIGQLFLAGYIDFGSYRDNEDGNKIDYPTNLSYCKEDKYQAWIYFRDNFFYANKFYRDLDEPDTTDSKGYCLLLCDTSWDTPQYWSQYNIWVARTEKGTKYFNQTLAPKFYNKYKDLEVEIDDKGNIVRWIGQINR